MINFFQLENVMEADWVERLLAFTEASQGNFVPTTTATQEMEYRKSQVLFAFEPFETDLMNRVMQLHGQAMAGLQMTPFPISQIERQLTRSGGGEYYRVHNDNGSPDCANRRLTYVYYYSRPDAFVDGQLKLYDMYAEGGYWRWNQEKYQLVTPKPNSIVFFESYYMHEVLPVMTFEDGFMDARFTINGWLRD